MARQDRIKRRMIRQLVRDNLETLEGAHPRRRGRRLRTVLTVARVLLLVALPAALFTSTYVLSTVAAEWRDDVWQDDAHNPTFSTRAPISFSEVIADVTITKKPHKRRSGCASLVADILPRTWPSDWLSHC